ncbi:MAG: hypothetical protein IKS83_01730 [Victivallales bacterium]|nr:hypothetical protein [Victivallales bacterium]
MKREPLKHYLERQLTPDTADDFLERVVDFSQRADFLVCLAHSIKDFCKF